VDAFVKSEQPRPLVPVSPRGGENDEQHLSITLVFTTSTATLHALEQARELAHQLAARIRILVPQVVPYPLPIDRPPVDPIFRLRQFRTFLFRHAVETHIDVRLCRNARECLKQSLAPQSIVSVAETAPGLHAKSGGLECYGASGIRSFSFHKNEWVASANSKQEACLNLTPALRLIHT
jgi:hypothetical protein